MPRRRRAVYIVQKGTLVVQRRSRRVIVFGYTDPLIYTRIKDATRAAEHSGGSVIRFTKKSKPRPLDVWWE